MVIMILWAIMAALLLWQNMDLFDELEGWRTVLVTVILTFLAPVFFIADLGELLLDYIAGEEEDS